MNQARTVETNFYSGPSVKMAATMYLPRDADANGAGVVFCHGFGGVRGGVPVGLSTRLADAGFVVMAL